MKVAHQILDYFEGTYYVKLQVFHMQLEISGLKYATQFSKLWYLDQLKINMKFP